MSDNIKISVKVNQLIDVDLDIEEIIDCINEMEVIKKWNFMAKMINGFSDEDISKLNSEQKSIIRKYLENQIIKFE